MSWLKIDDEFEDHAKVEPLSDSAHRLWLRAACWCRKAQNAHTNGFVPEGLIETIARRSAPKKRLLELAQELVDARAGGTKTHGLWEPREGGWQFHDWHFHTKPVRPRWSTFFYRLVFARDGKACRYCGSTERPTVDHVTPRCQGGSDSPENLVVACRSCNSRKGGRTPEQAGMVLQ